MDIKVGDVFVRRSDERVWTVKKIDGIKVVLESPDKKVDNNRYLRFEK